MVRASALLGLASAIGPQLVSCQLGVSDALYHPMQQNANSPALFPMPPCGSFRLEEATIDDMQAGMRNGTLTSYQLVLCYMQRMLQTQEYISYVSAPRSPLFPI